MTSPAMGISHHLPWEYHNTYNILKLYLVTMVTQSNSTICHTHTPMIPLSHSNSLKRYLGIKFVETQSDTCVLELIHTSTLARLGMVRYDKNQNVNTPTTEPYRTGPAHSIKPGWHGMVRLLLKQRIEIIIIPLSLLLSWRQQQTGLAKKPSNLSACGAKKNALSSQSPLHSF